MTPDGGHVSEASHGVRDVPKGRRRDAHAEGANLAKSERVARVTRVVASVGVRRFRRVNGWVEADELSGTGVVVTVNWVDA